MKLPNQSLVDLAGDEGGLSRTAGADDAARDAFRLDDQARGQPSSHGRGRSVGSGAVSHRPPANLGAEMAIAPDRPWRRGHMAGNDLSGIDVSPCYLAGTAILTDRGERKVETLKIGDRVVTLSGQPRPIQWIGTRSFAAGAAAGNRDVIPIRIRPGAPADDVPRRDLFVSPLHALYLNHVLVSADLLVNEATILRCPEIDPIRYFHIELETHDILLAERAPAESFIDCDSRAMFHSAADFAVRYPAAAAMPW